MYHVCIIAEATYKCYECKGNEATDCKKLVSGWESTAAECTTHCYEVAIQSNSEY